MDAHIVALRLGVAFLLGGLLGLERELRGQSAGLRTHLLVSLGSCLFTLASIYAAQPLVDDVPVGTRADITRIASQVVVGIGFLGGGAILRHGDSIRGLTTAANLWLTASIGLAAGLGFLHGAAITGGLALLVLAGLRPVEHFLARVRRKRHIARDGDTTSEKPPESQG
ncbi:MgtC/SapB family protein [Hyalangium rubrum]|uniref:MgtC/SapB family protein n=1 Tax=Hyalangium rubrum TaxID=3103134 RepID=A0ABU5H607_9BACT|nr:MgtC/SapB family protein [Hyalangium sp. s54d21]MDY7227530.1 MgtC/SapB family protein [Hyalangium sp. s54d21]